MKFLLLFILPLFLISQNYTIIENFSNNKTSSKAKIKIKTIKKSPSTHTKTIKPKKIKKITPKKDRAKLVIVIDDISHKYQLNYIKSLPFKVTPSIFPPSKMNMHSNKLAKNLKHYMVHLPLQSNSKILNRMHKTIFITNSNKEIRARVAEIKRLFPNVKFLNNHTGSIFTQNYKKSKVLYKALLDNNITFVDSRTTQRSQFKRLSREFNKPYYKSDLFIDNNLNISYILNQIRKGVLIAKKRGNAIIIGHPHKETFKALKMAKKYFKNIDIVYIDEL